MKILNYIFYHFLLLKKNKTIKNLINKIYNNKEIAISFFKTNYH